MKPTTTETVLITGASSGIGLELAKCFAAEGAELILVARSTERLEKLAAELRQEFSIQATVITADLAQPEAAEKIFAAVKGRGLTVDVLVNNAGFGLHGKFVELPLKRQLEIVTVNISALVELTGLFLPGMISRKCGGILNVGSVAGFVPGPNMAVYYASKAFVQSFSEALYQELRGTTIKLTNLCPGPTETNFSQTARMHRTRTTKIRKMSAVDVAEIGHEDFRAGKFLSVPGATNKLAVIAPRFLPRAAVRKLVGHYNKLQPSD
jgi:short-subunit dehydrogenase